MSRRISPVLVAFAVVAVGIVAYGWLSLRDAAPTTGPSADPVSGLLWVDAGQLPPEASDTLAAIAAGPPYPYRQDGATFFNREGLLPPENAGYYREFTVDTPGSDDRGARRIGVGEAGEYSWTDDHYTNFWGIRR